MTSDQDGDSLSFDKGGFILNVSCSLLYSIFFSSYCNDYADIPMILIATLVLTVGCIITALLEYKILRYREIESNKSILIVV